MAGFLDDYEPVEDRLRQFWTQHPHGRVITNLEHHGDGDYIVKAEIYYGSELRNDPPTATGYAHDSVAQLPQNMKASALEVCETSAIGRALANAGYAAKGKRPSREEMQKVSPAGALPEAGDRSESRPEALGEGAEPVGAPATGTQEQWAEMKRLYETKAKMLKALNDSNEKANYTTTTMIFASQTEVANAIALGVNA